MTVCHVFPKFWFFKLLSLNKKCAFKNIIAIIRAFMRIICCISFKRRYMSLKLESIMEVKKKLLDIVREKFALSIYVYACAY